MRSLLPLEYTVLYSRFKIYSAVHQLARGPPRFSGIRAPLPWGRYLGVYEPLGGPLRGPPGILMERERLSLRNKTHANLRARELVFNPFGEKTWRPSFRRPRCCLRRDDGALDNTVLYTTLLQRRVHESTSTIAKMRCHILHCHCRNSSFKIPQMSLTKGCHANELP